MPGKQKKINFPLCIVICNSQVFPADCSCKLLHFIARKSDHLEDHYNAIVSIRVQLHRKLRVGRAKCHFLFHLTGVLIKWLLSILLISLNLWGGGKKIFWLRNPISSIKISQCLPPLPVCRSISNYFIFSPDSESQWRANLGCLICFFLFM